jgi:hypothetical protein
LPPGRRARLKRAELEHLGKTTPTGGAGASNCSTTYPRLTIRLTDLPADRLRPLLDAFAMQLRYNLQDNSVKIEALISAEAVPHLARLAHATSHHQPVRVPIRPRNRA